ncbi:sensor histidine kinase [Streptacidiphilus sp. N1-12]|uniref:histidine kinase n=2 Tax=Streptacidiphilus alkalitolerans TaxID=3342712 RepID=A0ABV6V5T2_9ACTN
MRLSTRIALVTAAIVPVMVLLAGLLLLGLVNRDLHAGQDGRLRDRAASALPFARTALRAAAAGRTRQEANQQLRLSAAALDAGVRLTADDGTVLVAEGAQPADGVPLPAGAAASGGPVTFRAGGVGWRVLALPVTRAAGQPPGTLWLFAPTAEVGAEVASVRRRIVLVALLAAPLGGLLAFGVAERAARPLRTLQRRTGGLDPDDPASRVSLGGRPTGVAEVDQLARTLQSVLQRYDAQAARTAEALETARAFAASASHELRTPLMSMRTNLDVLADHPDLGPAERAEVLADLHTGHARMLGLLTALRSLAQGDLVEADAFGAVDLAELVEAAVADARRRAPQAVLTVRSAPSLRLRGWEPGLRLAVDNLLVNALVHGGGGDRPPQVAVELRTERDQVVLTVDDAGPGVPPELRETVFERFRRGRDSPGSGLGLTLVAQQIALHGGTVRLTDTPSGRGTRAEVRLPSVSPATLRPRRGWLTAAT